MDTVEQAAAPVGAPAEEAVEAPAAPQDQAPVTAEAVTKEAETHKICRNCNYHDPSGKDALRCPACNFRHASQPVHQAPAKKDTPAKNAETGVLAEDAAKADDKPAEEPAKEPAADDKSGEAQPAEDKAAEEVVDGQAVRVVEKIIVVEKAPEPAQGAVQDAGKAVEEQG